jgi:hypothetical protein
MVNGTVRRAKILGALAALDDLPSSGKPPLITPEARTWRGGGLRETEDVRISA